ncbi:3-isopropylmalate dehydrogenase [Paenibacillus apiarius]|uniref:3-isopropylmalate dehydrogenase n=1 Tax=Paenibacillus apiarius TaxID=46240 RepID=A0ABT4DUR3_9BACL|nr:3-isopropylmalate dehydrogenase [Paenibacillus apiarius]MCY9512582.1 3-isopropylmalate dehydrogenase [Paenibacillus apiarius]MCY9519853.1 3-isopropylmalate dehydrogenase [Paenibacillus apiarius]MCY9553170.1 3-isopropylmalate dehydrogenase [Paenibacillus apiarius]MCY9559262.1 3-isopropylmalate dehydrogenase [Paenibacillus apiarius]MCY9682621.1 3-isopropylmalate dehydrogenase [Paenibacillus apiarius]
MPDVKKIAIIAGDGIGPEVVREAEKVLKRTEELFGHSFETSHSLFGGIAIDETGTPLPEETLEKCKQADAVLLGAVGGPKWDSNPKELRPETGLLGIRKALGLFSNIRPAVIFDCLKDASTLKPEVLEGTDLIVVRELTGGIYFGEKFRRDGEHGQEAVDTCVYNVQEVERIVRQAFEIAQKRRKKLASVDKANVLETSRLWRETVNRIAPEYPDVELEHVLVDNCAMQLLRRPSSFDVIVTENMFGDILSDEAAMLTGSIGMLSSASLGEGSFGLYEPVHGSAPDIAGQGVANPIATILSVALMFRLTFGYEAAAQSIETAVKEVLDAGHRTGDIATDKSKALGTEQMGDLIVAAMK